MGHNVNQALVPNLKDAHAHYFIQRSKKFVWRYFATSHGKSASDRIGTVVKYQARRPSLHRIDIFYPNADCDLFNFSKERITKVNTLWLDGSELSNTKLNRRSSMPMLFQYLDFEIDHRFESRTSTSVPTIKIWYGGTQLNNNSTNGPVLDLVSMTPGSAVAYAYNNKWYVGSIINTVEENHDIYIDPMLPHKPSKFY